MNTIYSKIHHYVDMLGLYATIELMFQKLLRKKRYKIHIRALKNPIWLRVGTQDMTVLKQLFGDKELDISINQNPKVIIDAGANVGYATRFFHEKFPEATIVSLEPESSNIEMFKLNCDLLENIHLIEGGLWPRSAYLRIISTDGREDGFRVEEHGKQISNGIRGYTVDEILNLYSIDRVDLFKIDIEGAEKDLFEADVDSWISKVGIFMVELHDRFKPGCEDAVFKALESRSHRIDKLGEYHIFYLN